MADADVKTIENWVVRTYEQDEYYESAIEVSGASWAQMNEETMMISEGSSLPLAVLDEMRARVRRHIDERIDNGAQL